MQQQPQQPQQPPEFQPKTLEGQYYAYQQSSDLFRPHPDAPFDPSEWHRDDLVYTAGHIIGWGV